MKIIYVLLLTLLVGSHLVVGMNLNWDEFNKQSVVFGQNQVAKNDGTALVQKKDDKKTRKKKKKKEYPVEREATYIP